ncbi:MAG TPA: hypothetical protein VFU49_03585 [Ktedonobacteraceae bacterium]|nr:hypothetical protein [Ktedonobacteraceae bacterium]
MAEIVAHCQQEQQSLQKLFDILQEIDIRGGMFTLLWQAQSRC